MTDAELRIMEFLMITDATRPADLPDWMLTFLDADADADAEPSHETHHRRIAHIRPTPAPGH